MRGETLFLLLPLIPAAAWDIRGGKVPSLLSNGFFFVSLAWAAWKGNCPLAGMGLFAVLAEYIPGHLFFPSLGLATGFLALLSPHPAAVAAFAAFYLLWRLGILGGADTKVGMGVVAFVPETTMLACLAAGSALAIAANLLARYGRSLPERFVRVLWREALPTRVPLIPGYLAGVLLWLILC